MNGRFKVFYDDDYVFDSNIESLDKIKGFGVLAIVQERANPNPRPQFLSGYDFYYLNTDEELRPSFRPIDISGIMDRLLHHKPVEYLLQGRMVSTEKYEEILTKAQSDSFYLELFGKAQ